jgi:formylglycine-generating enzyme required for sulfatase activity
VALLCGMTRSVSRPKKLALLTIIALLAILAIPRTAAPVQSKTRLYAAGESARTEGRWLDAFAQYDALCQLDPGYRDVRNRIEEAARNSLNLIPGEVNVETEVRLLWWLAQAGHDTELAEVLERVTVPIPAGEFTMGDDTADPDERPQRRVYLDTFVIDRYEVTNAQYQRFVRDTGRSPPPYWQGDRYLTGQAAYPVVGVSWEDAHAYCTWAGKRLPTEAEWEKACRGTDTRRYPWGNRWEPARANVGLLTNEPWPSSIVDAWMLLGNTPENTQGLGLRPVGSYLAGASPYGVVDLVGNVEEWVADWYRPTAYRQLPARNPVGTGPEWARAIRGSAWVYRRGLEGWVADFSRCSARNSSHAHLHPRVGFRCARSLPG